jgi:hypothetical protein
VFIRHEANLPSGGQLTDIDISTFLNEGQQHPQHQALLRLIGALIECSPRASKARRRNRAYRRHMCPGLPRRIRTDSLGARPTLSRHSFAVPTCAEVVEDDGYLFARLVVKCAAPSTKTITTS